MRKATKVVRKVELNRLPRSLVKLGGVGPFIFSCNEARPHLVCKDETVSIVLTLWTHSLEACNSGQVYQFDKWTKVQSRITFMLKCHDCDEY